MGEYVARAIRPAPQKLVSGGRFEFGTFNSQFGQVNPLEADRPLGAWLPRPLLAGRLKEWQAFQFGNSRWFMLAVLYNAKISALAQFIAYDRESGQKYVFEKILPPCKLTIPASIWDNKQSWQDNGNFIEIISALNRGRFYINVKLRGHKSLPDIEAHFEAFQDRGAVEPLVVSIPFGRNRGMYSHKCLMPMQGSLVLGGARIGFLRSESFAIIDDHKGFYPYEMHYDWATAAGYDVEGRLSGFNLTDNQSTDPEGYNENCLWVDGRLSLLPAVKFDRPGGVDGDWIIRDRYGLVDLVFRPVTMGRIDVNLLVMRVQYFGPFGYCSGTIKDSRGNPVVFDRYFGMGEKKYIRG